MTLSFDGGKDRSFEEVLEIPPGGELVFEFPDLVSGRGADASRLEVRVIDSQGQPLREATVIARFDSEQVSESTDERGTAIFAIPQGLARSLVEVFADGYLTEVRGPVALGDGTTSLEVSMRRDRQMLEGPDNDQMEEPEQIAEEGPITPVDPSDPIDTSTSDRDAALESAWSAIMAGDAGVQVAIVNKSDPNYNGGPFVVEDNKEKVKGEGDTVAAAFDDYLAKGGKRLGDADSLSDFEYEQAEFFSKPGNVRAPTSVRHSSQGFYCDFFRRELPAGHPDKVGPFETPGQAIEALRAKLGANL